MQRNNRSLKIYQNGEDSAAAGSERSIFESTEDMHKSLTRLCYGNLYILGSVWIEGLKYVLTGSKMCLVPRVHAAPPPPPPQYPPRMKVDNLPLYGKSPHVDYANYQEDQGRKICPELNEKLLQKAILPTVSKYRKGNQENFCETVNFAKDMKKEVAADYRKNMDDFKKYMRSSEHDTLRKIVFALGPILGYVFAKRKGFSADIGRLSFAILGGLYTGWLCYPKETDETLRNTSHGILTNLICLYNCWTGCSYGLHEHGVCRDKIVKQPPPRKADPKFKCPPTKPINIQDRC